MGHPFELKWRERVDQPPSRMVTEIPDYPIPPPPIRRAEVEAPAAPVEIEMLPAPQIEADVHPAPKRARAAKAGKG